MTYRDILSIRLQNEQLNGSNFNNPQDLVKWFGAVQSQDYPGAKWALGQRLNLNDDVIEKSFNEGKILRTHIMRPTWHFVSPDDIVWMQQLTSPRVKKIMNYYNRILGLDDRLFAKTNKIIEKALMKEKFLTRLEIKKILEENGIITSTQKLGHIMSQAELDAVICSGPKKGKQFTYALVQERAPEAKTLKVKDALKELVHRYFQSHGPATVKDFVWWSGLTTTDARIGIEKNNLKSEVIEGKNYWFIDQKLTKKSLSSPMHLLPNYDEYTIAYQDREAFLKPEAMEYFKDQGNAAFWNAIVNRGKIIGMWKKKVVKKSISLKTQFFKKLSPSEKTDFDKEVERLSKFLGLPVVLG